MGRTDSESFRRRKIPSLTIHTLTQKSENEQILHTKKDKLSAMNLDHYYDTYHLAAVYVVYLDQFLAELPDATFSSQVSECTLPAGVPAGSSLSTPAAAASGDAHALAPTDPSPAAGTTCPARSKPIRTRYQPNRSTDGS